MKLEPYPESLFMEIPSYGMTGTLEGATDPQLQTLLTLVTNEVVFLDEFYWHFGDAVGADKQAFDLITQEFPFSAITVAHPGLNEEKRAFCKAHQIRDPMENLGRNARIAYSSHQGLFGLSRTHHEVLRSGTWQCIRTAGVGKLGRPTYIIAPDGGYHFYEKGYLTELRRDTVDRDEVGLWSL